MSHTLLFSKELIPNSKETKYEWIYKIILKIKYQKAWAIIVDDFIDGADILYPLYKTKKEAHPFYRICLFFGVG
jgi:hypothetical protein